MDLNAPLKAMTTLVRRRLRPFFAARAALATVAAAALLAALVAHGCEPSAARPLTIVLVEYDGPEAGASAQRLSQELSGQGLADVFVVEGAHHASVCVGRFDSWKDPKANATLNRVRQIRDARGQYPFMGVMLMPVPEPLPENPWPLEKTPGLFTFHVASWEAPGRAAAAQAYAAQLRSRGFEAYVYHGPRLSMVTIGAFGPDIFDDPAKIDRPGVKPKIVSPVVLGLIQKFPRMRLEGQEVPVIQTEKGRASIPTQIVRIPGRRPEAAPPMIVPKSLYRVTLSLVSTQTGLAERRGRAGGVAQSREEIPVLILALVGQMLDSLPKDKTARIGVVGVLAADPTGASEKADAAALDALLAALGRAEATRITVVSPATTRQLLDAARRTPDDVLRNPQTVKGVTDLDFVITGSVTTFTR